MRRTSRATCSRRSRGRSCLPAIADQDELHRVETVFGRQSFGRKAGEALHPEREPPEMLEQIRRTIGEYNFAGQYHHAPSPQGGGMVKSGVVPELRGQRAAGEVLAHRAELGHRHKATELSDFSVCTSWGISGKDLYLLHVYPESRRAVR